MGGRGSDSGMGRTSSLASRAERIEKKIKSLQDESMRVLNSRKNSYDPVPQRYYDLTNKVRDLKNQLSPIQEKLADEKRKKNASQASHTFVNGFGEATNRYVTSQTYERAQKRLTREIDRRFRGR